jgi:hypothetical protein
MAVYVAILISRWRCPDIHIFITNDQAILIVLFSYELHNIRISPSCSPRKRCLAKLILGVWDNKSHWRGAASPRPHGRSLRPVTAESGLTDPDICGRRCFWRAAALLQPRGRSLRPTTAASDHTDLSNPPRRRPAPPAA